MYHVGRPGHELLYHQRILHSWGIDGHNSHTNVCSAGARAGYAFWSGIDRPSPDHANARFILLLSSHLEAGHYFNPHAQRIIEAKNGGTKICVIDTRLSNTASKADYWISSWPGSEGAILLAMCNIILQEDLFDRQFVRQWVNWEDYLREEHADKPLTFQTFIAVLKELYAQYTPEFAAKEAGIDAKVIVEVAHEIAKAGSAFSSHVWRNTAAGNLGGWQVARALQFLVVLVGAVGTPGGTAPNAANKFVPMPPLMPPPAKVWNELLIPPEYPLAFFEMSFLLPHFIKEGRGKLAMYFTRVYNPGVDQSRRHELDRNAVRRKQSRAPRLSHADVERDSVVRRLCPADGSRVGAPRSDEPGNSSGALDRFSPADFARRVGKGRQEIQHDLRGARSGRHRTGLGRRRVLDRALVAGRPGRLAGYSQTFRVALRAGQEDDGR